MKKFIPFIVLASVVFSITLIVPALLVLPFAEDKASGKASLGGGHLKKLPAKAAPDLDTGIEVAVYRSSEAKIEKVPLEDYLVGVVASEMPADFQPEALKAQALTARTYIVRQIINQTPHPGLPPGAEVGDTTMDQVYSSDDQLRTEWGAGYSWKRKKILDAVRATSGQILTYNGEPIQATFFSTSNGYTENSEDYWSAALPYLRSVPSPWDKNAPNFIARQVMSVRAFETKLGIDSTSGTIAAQTAGHRVGEVNFSGKILTGKEVREKLGLRSADFTWQLEGANVIITTKGFGHGVGMSQYGANGMAAAGKTCVDIVKYYYTGIEITSDQNILSAKT